MHPDAYDYVARVAAGAGPFGSVLDIGGRDINGTVRPLFAAAYTCVDLHPGPAVDIVGDVVDVDLPGPFDAVVCCEVLEHAPDPGGIVAAARRLLAPGGMLILTMAMPPRYPHSGIDGGALHPDEHYRNIEPAELEGWLAGLTRVAVEVHADRGDLYAIAAAAKKTARKRVS